MQDICAKMDCLFKKHMQIMLNFQYDKLGLGIKTSLEEQMPYRNKFQCSIYSKGISLNLHQNLSVFVDQLTLISC